MIGESSTLVEIHVHEGLYILIEDMPNTPVNSWHIYIRYTRKSISKLCLYDTCKSAANLYKRIRECSVEDMVMIKVLS